jgi:DNA-binding GntR family transcriptional regulator
VADHFKTKKDVAVERLRHAIQAGHYESGDRLRQNDLAKDFGLSSTPIREALLELQSMGLVTHEAHRGVRVAPLDVERIGRIYTARLIVERETARLAFPHVTADLLDRLDELVRQMKACVAASELGPLIFLDETFHFTMLEASGNEFLVKAAKDLWNTFPRYLIWNIGNRLDESMNEHGAMVSALRTHDKEQYLHYIEHHIQQSQKVFTEHLLNSGNTTANEDQIVEIQPPIHHRRHDLGDHNE